MIFTRTIDGKQTKLILVCIEHTIKEFEDDIKEIKSQLSYMEEEHILPIFSKDIESLMLNVQEKTEVINNLKILKGELESDYRVIKENAGE